VDAEIRKRFMFPPYWFVCPLEWPSIEVTMAEAAFSLAPTCVSRKGLPDNVADVLGFTELYAREHPSERMVWFTDVTRWMGTFGKSWNELVPDWEEALLTIPDLPILGLRMTISRRAYAHLVDAAETTTLYYTSGESEVLTREERWKVHEAFIGQMESDWPKFIDGMITSGRLTVS
jgi:hypothetical protein